MTNDTLATQIYEQALACGFDNCGIIPLEDMDGFRPLYRQRIRRVPSSAFVYKAVGDLSGIKKRFPWAKAVVICTVWLGKYRFPQALQGLYAKAFLLSPTNRPCEEAQEQRRQFEAWFPVHGIHCEGGSQFGALSIGPLRYAARMAGLGILRKNNFLYTEKGSYVELVGYVIDQPCTLYHTPDLKPCGEKCDLCQRHCPSHALCAPYTMSPLKCVSFLTTFGKGKRPLTLKDRDFGQWVCGCDSCQDACPHNRRHDWTQGEDYPGLEELAPALLPEQLLQCSDAFLRERVLPMTAHHVDDINTLRHSAERSLRAREEAD